jgi:two-component system chemotaxis response regulator CheB
MARVLVVDDSALMRRLLGTVLGEAGFEVLTARNGAEGLQRLIDDEPDVVTLDINMPEMDGLTALSLMMQARPTPVVMVSSLTAQGAQATFEALALGAVDFIAKPDGTISLSLDAIAEVLVQKVRAASRARLRGATRPAAPPPPVAAKPRPAPAPVRTATAAPGSRPAGGVGERLMAATQGALRRCPGVVLVGVSTGGPRTLEDILPKLPAHFPWPVVIAQHMPAHFTDAFARRMDRFCALAVREVNSTIPLEPGLICIGQGGGDMVLTERLGRVVVQPRPETPGHPWHPSVDVLVDSALDLLPAKQLIGVQLTGMGNDGAAAMTRLKAGGGRTIAESEETAVVFGMPQELIQRGGASAVLPCQDIARQLNHWLGA